MSGVGKGSLLGTCHFICGGMCSVNIVAKRTVKEPAKREIWVEVSTLEFADDTLGVIIAETEQKIQEALNVMSDSMRWLR